MCGRAEGMVMHMLFRLRRLSLRKRICLAILLFYLLTALLAPLVMPYSADDFSHPALLPPGAGHLLGTDEMGHDIFSLLLNGFRVSVALALVSGALSTLLGALLAFCACYLGRAADGLLTAFANLFLIVPELVVIMFVAVFAAPTTGNTVLVIVLFSWPRVFKIIRGRIKDCISGSRVQYTLMMKGSVLDVARKLLPDVLPSLQAFFVLQCNKAVLYETTLAFFGVGDPLAKTWGKLIRAAMDYENLYYDNTFLWYLVPPVAAVVIFVVSLALLVTEEK